MYVVRRASQCVVAVVRRQQFAFNDNSSLGNFNQTSRLPALHYSVDFKYCPLGSSVLLWNFETIRRSLMRPKWPKLASLAQKICSLWFQFFDAIFASKEYPFKNIFDFTTACDLDCVAVVERLPALHYSVDFIFLSFGILGFIVEL